jgi:2-polyprenyl-3-methyl-5-hydroxy-6-metoxy-1,4-benzoquinol methylase
MQMNPQLLRRILNRLNPGTGSAFGQKKLSNEEAMAVLINSYYTNKMNTASGKYPDSFNAEYYQQQHESNNTFSTNNWLVEEIPQILCYRPTVICELACGNGEFSKQIAPHCKKVYAIDWAKSPMLEPLPHNVEYKCINIVHDPLPQSDLCCSADFLEHLPTSRLENTIEKIACSAKSGYHKIACYDDGHSHLSILPPWEWLKMFEVHGGNDYRVKKVEFRRGDPTQIVIVITNII